MLTVPYHYCTADGLSDLNAEQESKVILPNMEGYFTRSIATGSVRLLGRAPLRDAHVPTRLAYLAAAGSYLEVVTMRAY